METLCGSDGKSTVSIGIQCCLYQISVSPSKIKWPWVTVALLLDHRERQQIEKQNVKKWTDHNLIFCNSKGNPESITNLRKRHFKPIIERANLPKEFRMYDLRHSCATLLLEKNINPKIVQERLGHSTITLTLNTYSHVTPGMQELARDALNEAVFSKLSKSPGRQLVGKKEKADDENAA